MTKTVRVENADTNTYVKVVVQGWERGLEGVPDKMVSEDVLAHPCNMVSPYITDTRYLVIKEIKA